MKIVLVGDSQNGVVVKARDNTGVGKIVTVNKERTMSILGDGNSLMGKKLLLVSGPETYHFNYAVVNRKGIECLRIHGTTIEKFGYKVLE